MSSLKGHALHRFIYVSRPSDEMSMDVLEGISAVAIHHNRRDDLTGLLLWADGIFFQMLEGPTLELDATISRIIDDQRHYDIVRIAYREISEITCGNWDMGCFPMLAPGFRSVFGNDPSVEAITQRFSSTPDTEFDDFFKTFYQNNVDRIQPF